MSATISSIRQAAAAVAAPAVEACAAGRVLGSALTLRACREAGALPSAAADSLDRAVALYERRQWSTAFTMLCRLADRRDPAAAKLALLMLRYGESLYGARFSAQPQQIARWATQVIDATPGSASPDAEACAFDRAA